MKRTRKRQIERAMFLGLSLYEKKQLKLLLIMSKAFANLGVSTHKLFSSQERHGVTNRRRWK